MNRLRVEQIEMILMLLVEGNSISAISRVTYVSESTVATVVDRAGIACKRFHDQHVKNLDLEFIECDEMWSYVYAKSRNVDKAKAAPAEAGDTWIWTALDRLTKLLVSYNVGSRDTYDATRLTMDLAGRLNSRSQVFTDQHKPYLDAMEAAFGARVDYAQIGKHTTDKEETETVKRIIVGKPDSDKISTSHVERSNLTLRMHNRRLIRRTSGFSKKLSRHEAMMALFAVYYNYCRVHSTIRTTPAIAAGLDTIVRGRRWLAQMVIETYEPPRRRGPYGSRSVGRPIREVVTSRGRSRAIRENIRCPNPECGSRWLPKRGKSEDKQYYRCRDCGYSFSLQVV